MTARDVSRSVRIVLVVASMALSWTLSLPAAWAIDNPYPPNGASSIILPASLSWDAVPGAHGYDVYFGERGTGTLDRIGDGVPSAFLAFPPVDVQQDYSWQVVAHLPDGDLEGPVWHFQTSEIFMADGYGLTGFWQSLDQTCRGSGPRMRCRLRGTFLVINDGFEPPPSSVTTFYLSDDVALDEGDQLLRRKGTLGRKLRIQTLVIDRLLPPGQSASGRHVIAVLDAKDKAPEVDERNNVIVTGAIP
jgi:hypothetical protein